MYDEFDQDEYPIQTLLSKKRFQKAMREMRLKWNIPPDGFSENDQMYEWQFSLTKESKKQIHEDLTVMIRDFKLSDRWREPLSLFLLRNNDVFLRCAPYAERKPEKDKDVVWIKVDAETDVRELLVAFKAAKGYLPKLPKKQRPKNYQRDLEVLMLSEQGWSKPKIARWLNEEREPKNEDEKKDKTVHNADSVASILKKLRKRFE